MIRLVAALGAGALFGAGLAISRMIDPAVVLGFLDIAGDWNATLGVVMAGALIGAAPGYVLARRRAAPLLGGAFEIPTRRDIDRPLVLGAVLFGLGWGLAGICPGPALAGLATLRWPFFVFVPAMAAGVWLHHLVSRIRPPGA